MKKLNTILSGWASCAPSVPPNMMADWFEVRESVQTSDPDPDPDPDPVFLGHPDPDSVFLGHPGKYRIRIRIL